MRSPGTTARAAPFGLGPDRAGYVGYPVEETKPDWAYEYLLGKLGEVEDALTELDAKAEPLTYAATRRHLVALEARLRAALASFEASSPAN